MAESTDLEARIRVLEDIEAIKKLKSKYFRCIDKKLWDELGECFSESAVLDFGPDKQSKGVKAIVDDFIERYETTEGLRHGAKATEDTCSYQTIAVKCIDGFLPCDDVDVGL